MTIEGIQLSPQQKHLWELMRADEGGAYQSRCAVRLQGRLDRAALKNAVEQVVERHEILRTVFQNVSQASVPVQVIARIAPSVKEIDLTRHAAQDQEIEKLFQDLERQPFAAESPVLVTLVELSEMQHVLLISVAAACSDSATLDNLVGEISKSYNAHLRGERLSDAPLQYADISEVFNELLDSEETETGRSYWQQQDLSSLQRLRLPFENEVAGTFETGTVAEQIAPDVFERLESLAREHSVSPAVVLLTCCQILLRRLTAQTDLIVGVNYDGRSYEGLSEALGLFARYIPVQTHVDDTQTFSNFLQQVEKTAREVEEWQDYFSPRLSDLEFLPYCFEFENTRPSFVAGDVTFSIVKRHTCFDRFKLKLRCSSTDAELQFDRSLCSSIDAEVLLHQFNTLLISALNNPHRPIAELEIMSARERKRILVDFNQTNVDYPQDLNLQQLFEAQAARTPDAVAVTFNEEELTYATLNARANQLAHHLQHLGIGPEARVGLYLERGPQQLITVLGILKAGGSYVPLDPASPPERLSFIIKEARLSALVTQSTLASSVSGVTLVLLGSNGEALASAPTSNPPSITTPENLAYIIYTSGSTGKPKGVMIEQRSVVNLLFALRDTVYKNAGHPLRVGLNAPLIFDASVKQLVQLLLGHNIHIVADEVRSDPAKFLSFIQRHQLSVFDCTPSQLKALFASGLDANVPAMILVGGEEIDEHTWRALAVNDDAAYFNVYGPTECTVDTTVCSLQAAPKQASIGRPLPNTQVYILDESLKLAPIGVPGEIHIGGAGLARGYLEQPSITAAAFVPNPFSNRGGERLYKSGDVGLYLADGTIKYLGRKDSQIKLSGYRVELKEIEAVMIEHPAVQDAVVITKPNETRPELVAYVVCAESDLQSLRNFARDRLPEYMVPGMFVPMQALPLTVNGKVDHQKLPEPPKDTPLIAIKYEAPCNDIERTIASIWQDELQVEKVGIYDNFFDLGGSSLAMARVFDRLQTTFDKPLKMVELFRHPTVGTLARYLSQEQPEVFVQSKVDQQVSRQKEARQRQRRSRVQRVG